MTGHQPLLTMRRAGHVPAMVWITDGDDMAAGDWHEHRNAYDGMHHAHIRIEEADIPEMLDLRCVVGLRVGLDCCRGASRAHRLHTCLVEAKAKTVITTTPTDMWTHPGAMNG